MLDGGQPDIFNKTLSIFSDLLGGWPYDVRAWPALRSAQAVPVLVWPQKKFEGLG